jgi:hypothetical protein
MYTLAGRCLPESSPAHTKYRCVGEPGLCLPDLGYLQVMLAVAMPYCPLQSETAIPVYRPTYWPMPARVVGGHAEQPRAERGIMRKYVFKSPRPFEITRPNWLARRTTPKCTLIDSQAQSKDPSELP